MHEPADDLRHRPEAHFLEELLAPVYLSNGITISTSDDEVIPPEKLGSLVSVHLGYRLRPLQEELGEPIYGDASRQRLLEFLHSVLAEIDLAKQRGYYLQWGGGE